MNLKLKNGFTLIEMMIVIAIVGILAAIAYPSYQEHVRTSKRADCAGALVGLASAMEREFTLNGQFDENFITRANPGYNSQCPIDGGTATYDFTVEVPAPGTLAGNTNTFRISAAPTGTQDNDKCGTLRLTNTGVKSMFGATAGLTVQNCW